MKRTLSAAPIPLGKFIAQAWRVPVKPARRPVRSARAHDYRHLVLPGGQHFITCSFCGNTIRVVAASSSAATHKGARR